MPNTAFCSGLRSACEAVYSRCQSSRVCGANRPVSFDFRALGVRARRRLLTLLVWGAVACAQTVVAAQNTIGPDELTHAPSSERLDQLVTTAQRAGWGTLAEELRVFAISAYEREPGTAGPWYFVYRWAKLFATPKAQALTNWMHAVESAGGAHANMARHYALPPGSLAGEAPFELQRWLVGHPEFSREFFNTLSEEDHPIEVLAIMRKLHAAQPAMFTEYPSLALAVAIVYDVPPPPDWPHGQIAVEKLPRRLPDPVEAFEYWVKLDRANLAAHKLKRLPASELKFVVDVNASFTDLTWARRNVTPPLSELAQAYTMVRYRKERLAANQLSWPGSDYSLPTILRDGGICVDQAYFATQVGKARGVPTLFFRGAGLDGRHAWFGFLSPTGWLMDAGRYEEQKYVTGLVRDPQTWRDLTDHELAFVSERFRALPLYQLSEIHADFALEYLGAGNDPLAIRSAREAVNREPRNYRAWQVLLKAQAKAGTQAPQIEATLREAMRALARYPELELTLGNQLVASMRGRGEMSAAAATEQMLAAKFKGLRADLSYRQAGEMLRRSIRTDDAATQFRTYQRLLETYGAGASIDFFDQVVLPFVDARWRLGDISGALNALERAKRTLRVTPGSQLEGEISRVANLLRKGGPAS